MKKIAILLVMVICVSIAGCGNLKEFLAREAIDNAQTIWGELIEEAEEAETKTKTEFEQKQIAVEGGVLKSVDDGQAAIKSYAVMKRFDEYCLVVTFDYTNTNPTEDRCFSNLGGWMRIYQDSAQINTTSTNLDKDVYTYIKPGATIEVTASITLRNNSSDVLFETINWRDDTIISSYTLKIK